jgi:hypothetical protein
MRRGKKEPRLICKPVNPSPDIQELPVCFANNFSWLKHLALSSVATFLPESTGQDTEFAADPSEHSSEENNSECPSKI